MGVVSSFSIQGLDIYFNSLDHFPPHFHVECAAWHIRVFIDSSSLERGLHFQYKLPKKPPRKFRGLSKKQKRELLQKVINHKAELLSEWGKKVCIREQV